MPARSSLTAARSTSDGWDRSQSLPLLLLPQPFVTHRRTAKAGCCAGPGQGSAFIVTLPAPSDSPAGIAPPATLREFPDWRILIVDELLLGSIRSDEARAPDTSRALFGQRASTPSASFAHSSDRTVRSARAFLL